MYIILKSYFPVIPFLPILLHPLALKALVLLHLSQPLNPQASGLPAVSLQFGAWAGSGMASRHTATAVRMERLGLPLIDPCSAVAAMAAVMGAVRGDPAGRSSTGYIGSFAPLPPPVVSIVSIDWQAFLRGGGSATTGGGGMGQAPSGLNFFSNFFPESAEALSAPGRCMDV
jgi:hypothetical protein